MAITALLELTLDATDLDRARRVLDETLVATRAFPGCVALEVLVDVDDPAHVVVHETWADLAADDAYRAWRATPDGVSELGSVLAGDRRLTRWQPASA